VSRLVLVTLAHTTTAEGVTGTPSNTIHTTVTLILNYINQSMVTFIHARHWILTINLLISSLK